MNASVPFFRPVGLGRIATNSGVILDEAQARALHAAYLELFLGGIPMKPWPPVLPPPETILSRTEELAAAIGTLSARLKGERS